MNNGVRDLNDFFLKLHVLAKIYYLYYVFCVVSVILEKNKSSFSFFQLFLDDEADEASALNLKTEEFVWIRVNDPTAHIVGMRFLCSPLSGAESCFYVCQNCS